MMITSLDYTDNSLDENMDFEVQSSAPSEKFSLLNPSSLTTPPPETASSPDSFTVYESRQKAINVLEETRPKPMVHSKRPRLDIHFCNQKLLQNHSIFREKLEKTYRRFKRLNDIYQKRLIVQKKCKCDQNDNQNCIFCKTASVSPSNSYEQSQVAKKSESTEMYINQCGKDSQFESIKDKTPLYSTDDSDIKNMINLLLECINKDNFKEVLEPYFYSNGLVLEGIEINRAELDNLEYDFFIDRNKIKSKKSNCSKEGQKRGRSSYSRNNRRLSQLSESSWSNGLKRARSGSASSTSTSSTRSSTQSINEACTSTLYSDKFDINNIFIPNDIMSCHKITPLKNHKIATPNWRELALEPIEAIQISEVLNEEEFLKRHEIPELKEKLNFTNKKKLTLFLNVENLDEIKSILNKISPAQNVCSQTLSLKSALEWPERHFPLSDADYHEMLKTDYFELK